MNSSDTEPNMTNEQEISALDDDIVSIMPERESQAETTRITENITVANSQIVRRNCTTSDVDRLRIVNSYLDENTAKNIAYFMNMKTTTVHEIIKKHKNTGMVEARRRGINTPKKLNEDQIEILKTWIDEDCSISLKELCDKISSAFDINVSKSTVSRYIDSFHYTIKRISIVPQRRNDIDTLLSRKTYALNFAALPMTFTERQMIFIDEVGFKVSTHVSRGRSRIGTPAVSVVPMLRSRNISVCCAMNLNGIVDYVVSTSPLNTTSYLDFITNLIAKMRNENGYERATLIMDNVPFHKSTIIRENIQNFGYDHSLLPPYSPFLNPIENMFSKWKECVKRMNCQNERDLMAAIIHGANSITSNDCEGYFRNMYRYITRCINEEIIND